MRWQMCKHFQVVVSSVGSIQLRLQIDTVVCLKVSWLRKYGMIRRRVTDCPLMSIQGPRQVELVQRWFVPFKATGLSYSHTLPARDHGYTMISPICIYIYIYTYLPHLFPIDSQHISIQKSGKKVWPVHPFSTGDEMLSRSLPVAAARRAQGESLGSPATGGENWS